MTAEEINIKFTKMKNESFIEELSCRLEKISEFVKTVQIDPAVLLAPEIKPCECLIINRNINPIEKPHPLAKLVKGHWYLELAFDMKPIRKLTIFNGINILYPVVIIDTDLKIELRFMDISSVYEEFDNRKKQVLDGVCNGIEAISTVKQFHRTRIEKWVDSKPEISVRLKNILLNAFHMTGEYPFEFVEQVNEVIFMKARNAGKGSWNEFVELRGKPVLV